MKWIPDHKDRSLHDLNELINKAFAIWLKDTTPGTLWQSCYTCKHMAKTGPAFCRKFKRGPPIDVIVGVIECEGYENENDIPFEL